MSAGCDALVLDFGGVISRTIFESHRTTERTLHLAPGTLTWRGPFDPASDSLWRLMQADEISERDYWHRRALEVGELVGESWESFPQFVQRIRGADPMEAMRPEAIAAIARVKTAGCKLAILSNELDLFYGASIRDRLPFLSDFDLVVDATYTGILKPDPRAYDLVTEGLGIPAERCAFVDDQLRNIKGAAAAGMATIHFDVRDAAQSYARALRLLGIAWTWEMHHA